VSFGSYNNQGDSQKHIRLLPNQIKNKGNFDPVVEHMSREHTDLRLRI